MACAYVLKELETRVVDVCLMGSKAMLICMFDLGRPVRSVQAGYRTPLVVGEASLIALGPWHLHFHQTL